MSENLVETCNELGNLQREYRDYVAKNGFDYQEYVNPKPGSFMERYKARLAELNSALGSKPLEYYPES